MRAVFMCWLMLALASPIAAQTTPRIWSLNVDRLASSDRTTRDIDAIALTIATPVKTLEPFTLGLQAGVVSTTGQSTESGDLTFSSAESFGLFTGAYLRLGPTEPIFIAPFVEGGIALMVTDRPFPNNPRLSGLEGRFYGKFDIRWGVDIALQDDLQIEAAFALNHISNGSGFGAQNINFDGVGLSLGLKRRW